MSKSINLLPDPVIDTQRDLTKIYQGVIITLIGLILFGLFNLLLYFVSQQTQEALAETQQKADSLTQDIASLNGVEREILKLQARLVDYRRVSSSDNNFRGHWQLIRNAATDDMILEQFELRGDSTLDFAVTTVSLTNAVDFLLQLKNSETLSNFTILEINYHQTSDRYYFETRVRLI